MEVTVDWRCEAAAMDYAAFENYSGPVVPCDEPARVEVVDYRLCEGCADALEALGLLGSAVQRTPLSPAR